MFDGVINIYQTLAMSFIDGKCFQEFEMMSLKEKRACFECVMKLHSFNIAHGDLEPWNFIITYNSSGGEKFFFYNMVF